jgi:hypothetical protein
LFEAQGERERKRKKTKELVDVVKELDAFLPDSL